MYGTLRDTYSTDDLRPLMSNKFLTRKFREITEITNLNKPLMILDESKTVKDLNGGLLRSKKLKKL